MPHSSTSEPSPVVPLASSNTSYHNPALEDDNDIYRGEPPTHSPYPESTTSSTSSSSSWSFFAGRLGAFATAVAGLEQAIARWRRSSSSNSSSSSSSSSRSSILTLSRSQLARRRRRRGSLGNFQSLQSERDFTARISLIKAREQSRLVSRQFSLYIPPPLRSFISHPQSIGDVDSPHSQGVLWTSSLSTVLAQLDLALKKTTRTRKVRGRELSPRNARGVQEEPLPHHHFMLPDSLKTPSHPASFTDLATLRKPERGKGKDSETRNNNSQYPGAYHPWFLDVASPTSEDMRAIGKLLHLHPLTLEDILQQDPREKLELFPKLGYYFISFRAIESRKSREELVHSPNSSDSDLIGEANIYLVVFNEGVCSFHFTDMSEHTDRVRNRMISLEKSISMSSAWIAHGILDSIVDSFFPFSDEIEREVMAIEDIVYSGDPSVHIETITKPSSPGAAPRRTSSSDSTLDSEKNDLPLLSEKSVSALVSSAETRARFLIPRPPLPLIYKRTIRYIRSRWRPSSGEKSVPVNTTTTLRRMARTRRLVTSLTRLLATKSDVVAQVRKRLLTGLGGKIGRGEEIEVAIYMGDIQDHILTLQHSLAHYERMLSQSHPAYLAQLRNHVALTKSGTDKSLIYLTGVSMAVVCIQTVLGMFSLNVQVPSSDASYHVFGIVLAFACLVLSAYLSLVRRWWVQAKTRTTTALG